MTATKQRRAHRFDLQLPVIIRWKDGSTIREVHTTSRDVSSNGIYFLLDEPLRDGTNVEVEMTLPSEITLTQSVKVRCLGHVQRSDPDGVAAAIDRYEFRPSKSALNVALAVSRGGGKNSP